MCAPEDVFDTKVSGWENQRTKLWISQPVMFTIGYMTSSYHEIPRYTSDSLSKIWEKHIQIDIVNHGGVTRIGKFPLFYIARKTANCQRRFLTDASSCWTFQHYNCHTWRSTSHILIGMHVHLNHFNYQKKTLVVMHSYCHVFSGKASSTVAMFQHIYIGL